MRVARKLRVHMPQRSAGKQNVTISISPETGTQSQDPGRPALDLDQLLAGEIERLVGAEEAWERSERSALALLEQGFRLGDLIPASRDELHER